MDRDALPATGACYARSRWPGASVTEWIGVKNVCKSQDSEMGCGLQPPHGTAQHGVHVTGHFYIVQCETTIWNCHLPRLWFQHLSSTKSCSAGLPQCGEPPRVPAAVAVCSRGRWHEPEPGGVLMPSLHALVTQAFRLHQCPHPRLRRGVHQLLLMFALVDNHNAK